MTAALASRSHSKATDQLTFTFADFNPLTGVPLLVSRYDDLPGLIQIVVDHHLGLSQWQWDKLVRAHQVAEELDCHHQRIIPWSVAGRAPGDRSGTVPTGKCEDCWGTCVEVDYDGSLTGIVGASVVCFCVRG